MSQNGVAAFTNSWKTESFSTSDKKIDLDIQHSFWSSTVVTDGGYLVSNVTIKNTGNLALKDVQIYVDIDDDSALFDAYITDSNGKIIEGNTPVLNFGNLAPGATSTQISYWWTVRSRFPEAQGSEKKAVKFNLYPIFSVDFKQSNQYFQSTSQLDKA